MDTLTCVLFTFFWYVFAAAVTPEGQREMEVFAGQDVLLDCQSLKNDVTLLEWTRPDLKADGYVFFYREKRPYENYQHPHFHGRVRLGDPLMENGNMSVILANVQPDKDNGIYECCVSVGTTGSSKTTSSEIKQVIKLKVSPTNLGHTEKLIGDGGDQDGFSRRRNGFLVCVSLIAVMAFVVFVVICKRHVLTTIKNSKVSKRQRKSSDPTDDEAEAQRCYETKT